MNTRKFCLILTQIISLFLFCVGILLLLYINKVNMNDKGGISLFNPIIEAFKIDKEPFNTLFMVKEKSGNNTDTMLLINFDPSSGKFNAMSIPRDTYYEVKGSSIPKINSAYEYNGPSGSAQAVSEILNVNIKYYVVIDIKIFKQIVDRLGGVEFYIPADLGWDDPVQDLHINLKKGMQRLDGDKAEQLLRFRKTKDGKYTGEISKYYDGSDLKREEMQQKFIKALIEQKMNFKYLPNMNDIIRIIYKNVDTNLALSDALNYVSSIIKVKSGDIGWHKLPGKSKSIDHWYFIVDKDEAIKITSKYFVGKGSFVNAPK